MKYKINLIIQKKIPSKNILLKWVNWLNNSRVSKFSSRSFIKHTVTSQKKFVKQKITDKNCKLFLIKYLNLYIGVIELTNIEYKNKNCIERDQKGYLSTELYFHFSSLDKKLS